MPKIKKIKKTKTNYKKLAENFEKAFYVSKEEIRKIIKFFKEKEAKKNV